MKIANLAIVGSLSGILVAGTVLAEGAGTSDLRQPMSLRRTAFEYDNYAYFAPEEESSQSPSDQPAAAEEPRWAGAGCGEACEPSCCEASCCEPSCCESCDSGCGGCGGCCLGDPWTLPQPYSLESRGIKVAGWMSAGIFANAHGAASNGPVAMNDVGDGFTMNQLYIYAEKEADTGGYGSDWGFRIDYIFGVDGPDTQAFGDQGWDFGWNSSRDYGSAIPQLYVELAVNDLSVKLGHFYTLIGYEVVPAPDNFFYSHAYTHYYGEPFTHTGLLAEYAMNDRVTLYGGWTAGWDSGWENLNDGSVFLGGVGLALSDRATLTWAVTAGDFGAGRNGLAAGDVYMNSFVFEYSLTDKWTYIFEHDLGDNSGLGAANNEWYGINQYLLYEINDCWGAGMRFEWFRDDDGARVIGGNAGDYYGLTAGVNWKPHANVVLRPEIRYDWYDGTLGGGRPFGNANQTDQFSGGFDFIVTF